MPRPKVPTKLKLLKGTAQKCRMNQSEPEPDTGIPACPEHITGEARKEWDRVTVELDKNGLLTNLDRAALEGYCASYAVFVESFKAVQKHGVLVKHPSGFPVKNPALVALNEAEKSMHRFLTEFGMSPASRTKATSTGKKEPEKKGKWAL